MADINHVLLFRTDNKTKPTSPDWHGKSHIEVDGKAYAISLSGWNKSSERAGAFISMNIDIAREASPDPRDMVGTKENR